MEEKILPGFVRISQILSHLKNFDHIDRAVLERKTEIGSEVHKAIEHDFRYEFYPIEEKEKNYYLSFLNWQKEYSPICEFSEERLYCQDLMITGKLDAIIRFPGDSNKYLIDFKTSASEDPEVWPLQAHFYYYLYKTNYSVDISNKFIFLKLDKNGKMPKAFTYYYSENTMNRCFYELKRYREMTNKSS